MPSVISPSLESMLTFGLGGIEEVEENLSQNILFSDEAVAQVIHNRSFNETLFFEETNSYFESTSISLSPALIFVQSIILQHVFNRSISQTLIFNQIARRRRTIIASHRSKPWIKITKSDPVNRL